MKLSPRMTLKGLLIFVLGAAGGMITLRIMEWESSDEARIARVARRDLALFPPGYFDVAPLATKDASGPPVIQPGQVLCVEVLEALPGRPITGERLVLPDGTINLGFYGDVKVAGLNRNQIKVKVIEHLRKYINDEVLGLVRENTDGSSEAIKAVDSDRIFVDESSNYIQPAAKATNELKAMNARIGELDDKLDRVLKELKQPRQSQPPATTPTPAGSPPG
jgi:Polysaccharide biosynthesis/export protein